MQSLRASGFRATGKASRERHNPGTSLPRDSGGRGPRWSRHRPSSEAEPSQMEGPFS